ncbi:hypothetical protein Tco_0394474 [Tanacetum coccineum]
MGNFLRSPYIPLPDTTITPKKQADKSRNKTRNANILAFNLGKAVVDDNARDDEVMITGARATEDYVSFESVDPNKVARGHYVECLTFLHHPEPVFLDCHIVEYLGSSWSKYT